MRYTEDGTGTLKCENEKYGTGKCGTIYDENVGVDNERTENAGPKLQR